MSKIERNQFLTYNNNRFSQKRTSKMTEIGTLLLSSVLPQDVIIHEIYGKHLYKLKSTITTELKTSIVNMHYHFKKMLMIYYNRFDKKPNYPYYFLKVLKIDLGLAINDDDGEEVSREIIYAIYDEDINVNDLPDHLYHIWCSLSLEKKHKVYSYIILLASSLYNYNNVLAN